MLPAARASRLETVRVEYSTMSLLQRSIPLWILLIALPLAFALGGALGWRYFVADFDESSFEKGELREVREGFTNPLLECENFGPDSPKILRPFKYKVEQLLKKYTDEGRLVEASVYFRDLNNGMWFGINQELSFKPASLLKVPIMIAYFKLAEKDPELLNKKIRYSGDFDDTQEQRFAPSKMLEPGQSYTVDELIARMIIYSDNNSAHLLVENIGANKLDHLLFELNVDMQPQAPDHVVTNHAFTGFFRVLYNASYLNREYSEKALMLLAQSEFAEGIRAGVPPGVAVASKFGEWGMGPDKDIVQVHEFGIVYYPGKPYLLGIMTRGRRDVDFIPVLSDISRLIYEEVDQQFSRRDAPEKRMSW